MFFRKHYVYLIFSFRGFYIGKGSGGRVWESLKERQGLTFVIVGRYFTARNAFRAEARLIQTFRLLHLPLQNGRSPRQRWWKPFRLSKSGKSLSALETCIAIALLIFCWLLAGSL